MTFKDKLISLLKEQAELYPDEYVNPYLLGELLGAMYSVGYMDHLTQQEQLILDKYCDDMWSY